MPELTYETLTPDRRERVESWGMNKSVLSHVFRPTTADQISDVFCLARQSNQTVALRGAGCSYGDASLNAEGVTLDLSRMNRILAWDPETGVISCEPGVTIRQLWQYCIEDGWWPPVVSGTMFVTLGGALGMNIHGKNNFKAGPIGNHVREFDLLTPAGDVKTCSREQNAELFHAAIGGFGMLGVFTRITLQLKKVHSGYLRVDAFSTKNLGDMVQQFSERTDEADYLVGWVDCFARGEALGRGLVHQANYLKPGEDLQPAQSLRVTHQELPETLFGVFPKSSLWRLLRPFNTNLGMGLVNAAKYVQGTTIGDHQTVLQPHAQFAFLLDYVPNWKFAYKPGAMIQFQSFVPTGHADRVFSEQIRLSQKFGIVPYLGVFKRHKPDDFLMTHAVDGFSFALDYPYTEKNRAGLQTLTQLMTRLVVDSGGRHYFAKDSLLTSDPAREYLGDAAIEQFTAMKRACDPQNLLQSDLSRRLFGGFSEA